MIFVVKQKQNKQQQQQQSTSFVATKYSVATKRLLRQIFGAPNTQSFVSTNTVCRDKSFVASKMILVAAPANGRQHPLKKAALKYETRKGQKLPVLTRALVRDVRAHLTFSVKITHSAFAVT